MSAPNYPISITLRLDWSELDLFGHINNVSYFKYLQAARISYWERIGLSITEGVRSVGPMLASTKCDFRRPLHYPGTVTVEASVTEIGNTSFQIRHRMLDSQGNLCAEGLDVIVLYDYPAGAKVRIPQHLRSLIESLEGRRFADVH